MTINLLNMCFYREQISMFASGSGLYNKQLKLVSVLLYSCQAISVTLCVKIMKLIIYHLF